MRCEECKAWKFQSGFSGFCKRHAPKPEIMRKIEAAEYILVCPSPLKDDGCEEGLRRVDTSETSKSLLLETKVEANEPEKS